MDGRVDGVWVGRRMGGWVGGFEVRWMDGRVMDVWVGGVMGGWSRCKMDGWKGGWCVG